ncbi:UDP-glucuronic acid decarboxylase family protein [Mesobacillus campisalis]|uniref:UDP-glucuronic acid decarboxylase family protein n=1 Tax=Mesobacillus campisalis TaxID=1408103 RepID=UPI000AF612B4
MKKVIISGVAGFLGTHLAETLLEDGHLVIGIDNLISGKLENIKDIHNNGFTFIQDDVCSNDFPLNPLFKDVDQIYHLASPASPKLYQKYPFETINVNTIGTKNMLEIAKSNKASIVFTSTSEVYGDPEVHPQTEEYKGNVNTWGPRACYDEAKRLGEVLCYLYYSVYGVKVKVARIFNTYSAGLANDDGRVISNFISQALSGDAITVYGDGKQTRSFCYVSDTIRALKLLMDKDEANGELINIGNPMEYHILELAHLIKRLTDSKSPITFLPLPKDDPKMRRPDISKAKELLGWEPRISIEEGLEETIKKYKAKMRINNV